MIIFFEKIISTQSIRHNFSIKKPKNHFPSASKQLTMKNA
jgi:hypothetical protein